MSLLFRMLRLRKDAVNTVAMFVSKPLGHLSSYSRHKSIHTPTESIACSSCNKTFFRKDALNRHIQKKQCKGREKKIYICPKCGKQQPRKYHLERHLSTCMGAKCAACRQPIKDDEGHTCAFLKVRLVKAKRNKAKAATNNIEENLIRCPPGHMEDSYEHWAPTEGKGFDEVINMILLSKLKPSRVNNVELPNLTTMATQHDFLLASSCYETEQLENNETMEVDECDFQITERGEPIPIFEGKYLIFF